MTALILALLLHTQPTEVEHWLIEWQAEAVHGLTAEQLGAWRWMRDRHPCEVSRFCYRPSPAPSIPAEAPQGSPKGSEAWRGLVSAYFPAENVEAALRVLACESQGNPSAKNRTSSAAGLFQFLRSTWDWIAPGLGLGSYDSGAVYDPASNVAAAAALSKGGTSWSHLGL